MVQLCEDKTFLQYLPQQGESKSFYETRGIAADSTFFRLFTYEFIEGNPHSCRDAPNSVVVNEEIAQKLFGKQPALNKIINISSNTNGDTSFTVTGVFPPVKTPTQIDARFVMSMKGGSLQQFIAQQTDMAGNNMFQTFLLPIQDGEQGYVHTDNMLWQEEDCGWASQTPEPNEMGFTDYLSLLAFEESNGNTKLTSQ